jgi:hypothetical protein
LAVALTGSMCALTLNAVQAQWPDIREAKAIAEEGFIYGLPIVMNYAVMYEFAVDAKNSQFKAPFNQIKNLAYVATYKDTAVVTPNSDTPYSTLWFDLRAEPFVVSVPAVEKSRYYTVQLIDGNTFNFGYIGSRATGSDAGDYMVVGPNWQGTTPPGSVMQKKRRISRRKPPNTLVAQTDVARPTGCRSALRYCGCSRNGCCAVAKASQLNARHPGEPAPLPTVSSSGSVKPCLWAKGIDGRET